MHYLFLSLIYGNKSKNKHNFLWGFHTQAALKKITYKADVRLYLISKILKHPVRQDVRLLVLAMSCEAVSIF